MAVTGERFETRHRTRLQASAVGLLALAFAILAVAFLLSGADELISRAVVEWGRSHPDRATDLLEFSDLYEPKGVVTAVIVWWIWFRGDRSDILSRRIEAAALVGVVMLGILIGRLTANLFPYRPRPLVDPMIAGDLASIHSGLEDWSSFPSDHAIIFGAFAFAMIRITPRLGWWLLALHAILIVSIPRILVGKHYASDVLAGLALGAVLGWVMLPFLMRWAASAWRRLPMSLRRPEYGYPLLFLVTYGISTNFNGPRRILSAVSRLLLG